MKMIRQLLTVIFLGVGLLSISAEDATAQTNSLFGNNGPIGQTGGTTGRGTGGVGGTGSLTGNPLNSGGPGATQLGDLSNTINQGGFVGRSDNAGRFVGNANAGQQTNRSNRTFRGVQGRTTPRTTGGGNFNRAGFGGTAGTGSTGVFRPVHRVAFRHPVRSSAKINASLNQLVKRLAERSSRFKGLTIASHSNGEVVLRGTVESEATRKLAAAMMKLEPGVRSVKNELTVQASQ
ncbi:MAG: hypothetical protein Tsb009_19600 [Planctomycetaceae bacterium]